MYFMLFFTRAATILICLPFLNMTRYNMLTWQDVILLIYGALRGAIGLALVLIIDLDHDIPSDIRDKLLIQVCYIIILLFL
eukprot:UN15233